MAQRTTKNAAFPETYRSFRGDSRSFPCTVHSTGHSPKEIRNPGPEILSHEFMFFFILLPSSMIEAETFQSSLSKAYVSAKAKDGLLSNPL